MIPVNKSAPLKGIFQLIQARSNRVERMRKGEALFPLVCAMRLLPKNKQVYKTVINNLLELADNVPAHKLYFTKKCDFWRMIT